MPTSPQTLARIAGLLFIATFITAIAGDLLYNPLLDDPDYIVGPGDDDRVILGAVFELLLIIANIGTALALFPILKRQSEPLALGYVAARVMESVFIAVGILCVLAIVKLRQDGSADADVGHALLAIKNWTFVLGPGFVVGVGNGIILGYLMYRSGLVPRGMAMFGLIGGPLVCASGIAVMFGVFDKGSTGQGIATIPEIIWEASLGIYLTFKGFKASSPLLAQRTTESTTI
jgi:uncharacterized protein DUF4386